MFVGNKFCGGLHAIAYAIYLAYDKDTQPLTTHYFKQELMWHHLVKCLEQGHLTELPECTSFAHCPLKVSNNAKVG